MKIKKKITGLNNLVGRAIAFFIFPNGAIKKKV